MNFYATSHEYPTAGVLTRQFGPDLYLLFDVTGVPSRFVGTETWLNGNTFSGNAVGTELLHPPFNRIPNYREPGRVNFNTILNSATDRINPLIPLGDPANQSHLAWNRSLWEAIIGDNDALPSTIDSGNATSAEDRLVRSRRGENGFMTTKSGRINLAGTIPSLFGNPLRGSDGGSLVPITARSALLLASRPVTSGLAGLNMERPGVEVSALRSDRMYADVTPPDLDPPVSTTTHNVWSPLFAESSASEFRQTDKNASFRFRQYSRLPNLVTTRSNVYAVWVTIGYFEVDPTTGQLGQEVGADGGKIERHRSFYILDRSIPVAFEPGKDHNIERAILLRRYIE